MIPNQTGGQPGQYLKPSMLLSMAETSADKEAAAELMNFFITDPEANAILQIERGVSGDASVREGADRRPQRHREEDHRLPRHRRDLGRPAAAAAAEERRRARPGAAPGLGRHRPSSRSPPRRAPRSTTTTPSRSSRAPEPAMAIAAAADSGRHAPPALGERLRRGLRRNAAGYLFLLPWLIGFFVPDPRADARLALSLLHRLRPADPAALDRARRTTSTRSSTTSGCATRSASPSPTCSGRCR